MSGQEDNGTNQVPVVVISEDGRTLALDINLETPLTMLCPAIEKHFKVAAQSQVLKYNGDPLQLEESLKSSGALLLPGEPYVKLHLQTAKGTRCALIGLLPNGKEIPLSVPQETTFKDIKKLFVEKDPSLGSAKDVRLYFRYNELVDQASPRHFRLPNNSKIDVVRKLNFDVDSKRNKVTTSASESDAAAAAENLKAFKAKKEKARKEAAASKQKRIGARTATRTAAPSTSEGENSAPAAGARTRRPQSANARSGPSAGAGQAPQRKNSNAAGPTTGSGWGRLAGKTSQMSPSKLQGQQQQQGTPSFHTKDNRPKAFYELEKGEEVDEEEAEEERRRLRLMTSTAANIAGHGATGNNYLEGQVLTLQRQAKESDTRYQKALERISELEQTVRRYQLLCKNMTSTCSPEFFSNLSPMKQQQQFMH